MNALFSNLSIDLYTHVAHSSVDRTGLMDCAAHKPADTVAMLSATNETSVP